ncbi:hypothetical protein GCM10009836_61430 [Pseudonocardia ailaonensis]|uniref:non-specific serine/threonine protein kinase n=1 Tax=Pseudonocardia ailaonensis TaxID=367279 RepID=A0ABN2NJN0_9PSEU
MGHAEEFGPYRLDELVGRGGMGEVWRAWDTRRRRTVALKRLGAEHSGNREFEARFRRECELAARLAAPHVIPIHDYGEIDGRLFLDMRLVDGEDLGSRLRTLGRLEPAAAVAVITQLASALDAAHAAGLVHRDVKPSNALITADDFVYLVDFGIVKALASDTVLTSTDGVVGTAGYLAPERITGSGEDARSDVYALACVLYECLTGSKPFPAATAAAVVLAHVNSPVPRPGDRDARLRAFDAVVAAGMAKEPAARPESAGALARMAAAALRAPFVPVGPPLAGGPTAFGPTLPGPGGAAPSSRSGPGGAASAPAAASGGGSSSGGGPGPGSGPSAPGGYAPAGSGNGYGGGYGPGGTRAGGRGFAEAPPTMIGPVWGSTPPPQPPAPPRRPRWPWAAGIGVLLVAAAVAAVVVRPWERQADPVVEVPVITSSTTAAPPTPPPAAVPAVQRIVSLGGDPRSLVVDDRDAHVVIVPKRFTDQVVPVELASGAVGLPLDVSEAGGGIAQDAAGGLWVPRCAPGGGACSLDEVEREGPLRTGAALDRVPTNLVLEKRTGLAHVVVLKGGVSSVAGVDTATGRVVGGPVPLGSGNANLALSPDGNVLAFADGTGLVSLMSTRSSQVLGTVATGEGSTYLAFSPDGRRLYVSAGAAGTVAAVDVATRRLAAPAMPVDPGLAGIAVSADGSRLYVADKDSGMLDVLDAATLKTLAPAIRIGGAPTVVAVSGNRVLVLDEATDSLVVLG